MKIFMSITLVLATYVAGALELTPANLTKSWKQQNKLRSKVSLNGVWNVSLTDKVTSAPPENTNAYGRVVVPSCWLRTKSYPITNTKHFKSGSWDKNGTWDNKRTNEYPCAWYVRKFKVPSNFKGKRIILKFDNITMNGIIYLNGKKLGTQNEHYDVEWDISNKVKLSEANTLAVLVTAFLDKEIKLFLGAEMVEKIKIKADMRGITNDVWLYARPKNMNIENIFIIPSFRQKKLTVQARLIGNKGRATIAVEIFNAKGKKVKGFSKDITISGKTQTVKLSSKWNNPEIWDLDTPYLYSMLIKISQNDKVIDESLPIKFGFRELWLSGKDILLNGKPVHMITLHRYSHASFSAAAMKNVEREMKLFGAAGHNTIQLGMEGVWNSGHAAHLYDDLFNYADKHGLMVVLPLKPLNNIGLNNPKAIKEWKHHVRAIMERYRNHPSLVMWAMNGNYLGYPWDLNPHTWGMGYKASDSIFFLGDKRKKMVFGTKFIHGIDPSRVAYNHAGGNNGSISTSNFYITWPPLQEREDYPSKWSKQATKPFIMVELGSPSSMDYQRSRVGSYRSIRNTEINEAENCAPILGSKAYDLQGDKYLNIISSTATDKQQGDIDVYKLSSPYWWRYRIQIKDREPILSNHKIIFDAYIKSWRTYGLSGYSSNSSIAIIRGIKREPWQWEKNKPQYKYRDLTAPGAKPAENHYPYSLDKFGKLGTVVAKAQSPVIIYIGGNKKVGFSDKAHHYFSGETVSKSIVIVNDLRHKITPVITWSMKNNAGKRISSGTVKKTVKAGFAAFAPLTFKAPSVNSKQDFTISLNVTGTPKQKTAIWEYEFRVYPELKIIKGKIALFDPIGETAKYFEQKEISFTLITKRKDLKNVNTVIIGRKSLAKADKLIPAIMKIAREGGVVICLEQDDLKKFGLRLRKRCARQSFPLAKLHPVMKGVDKKDLINWRGKASMLPEYPKKAAEDDTVYPEEPWRWGNSGAVCSYMIIKPHVGAFKALADCEYDLKYTPLLESEVGRGAIVFSQFDLIGRKDPAAWNMLRSLINYAITRKPMTTHAVYPLGKSSAKLLEQLGVVQASKPGKIALWRGENISKDKLNSFETVIIVGQEALKASSIKTVKKIFYKAKEISSLITDGISRSDMFIKDRCDELLVAKQAGVKLLAKPGIIAQKGHFIFFTIDPDVYKNRKITPERMKRIRAKLCRALSIIMQNVGAKMSNAATCVNNATTLDIIKLPTKWRFKIDPKNKGRYKLWATSNFDDSSWQMMKVPSYWENSDVNNKNPRFPKSKYPYDGYAWYRCKVKIPAQFKGTKLILSLGGIDDMDNTYFNGQFIGTTNSSTSNYWSVKRNYPIPAKAINYGAYNTVAVKVFDNNKLGGISGTPMIVPEKENVFPYLNSKEPFNPYKLKRW